MKLIIDIDENYYKAICKRAERFGRGSVILSTPEKVILNGTPLQAEFEKIKAKLLSYEADCQITADTQTCMKCTADTFKSIEQILDKRIKEIGNE